MAIVSRQFIQRQDYVPAILAALFVIYCVVMARPIFFTLGVVIGIASYIVTKRLTYAVLIAIIAAISLDVYRRIGEPTIISEGFNSSSTPVTQNTTTNDEDTNDDDDDDMKSSKDRDGFVDGAAGPEHAPARSKTGTSATERPRVRPPKHNQDRK
jgi:hypothetical protein